MPNASREKLEVNDVWGARRRVAESLIAGIEVETLPKASHRARSTFPLHITYRSELPGLEDVANPLQKPPSS